MIYAKAKQFRNLAKVDLKIVNVFPGYRSGYTPGTGYRTFKSVDGGLKEQKWNGSNFELVDFNDKQDREFFKTYKKVYDVVFEAAEEVIVDVWSKEDQEEIPQSTKEVTIKGLSANKLQEMILASEIIEEAPMVEYKSEMRQAFDWEEEFLEKVQGGFVKFTVSGNGMDTKYRYKLGSEKAFSNEEKLDNDSQFNQEEDLPF